MAKRKKTDRLEDLVKLQQQSFDRWAAYAEDASRLMARGSVSPGPWMTAYARLSRGVVQDVGELLRLVFSGVSR